MSHAIGASQSPADHVAAGRLVRVFDEDHPFGYDLNALWPRTRNMPVRLRVVIDMLLEKLPAMIE